MDLVNTDPVRTPIRVGQRGSHRRSKGGRDTVAITLEGHPRRNDRCRGVQWVSACPSLSLCGQLFPLAASPTDLQLSPPADAWLLTHGFGSSAPTSPSAPPSWSHFDAGCTWLLWLVAPSRVLQLFLPTSASCSSHNCVRPDSYNRWLLLRHSHGFCSHGWMLVEVVSHDFKTRPQEVWQLLFPLSAP